MENTISYVLCYFFFPLCYQTLSPLITSEAKESLANRFKPKFSVLFQIGVTLFFFRIRVKTRFSAEDYFFKV